ncbi:MAG: GAF domain-containing sensor histidine kinase [candidate division KSB1 bacterium]|nr:GAF domain-containing sensor histidine kinase [candidate division KSB1 bacterium]
MKKPLTTDLASLPMEFVEILLENNRRMFANLNINDVFASILNSNFSLRLQPKIGLLFIYHINDNQLQLEAQQGLDESERFPNRFPIDHSLLGKTFQTGKTIISHEPQEFAAVIPTDVVNQQQIGTGIFLPLRVAGKILGVLNFYLKNMTPLSKTESIMLEILAGHAAVAIQNANLFSHLKSENTDLDFIVEIAKDITSSLELDQVLKNILKAAQQIADTKIAFLWYKDLITKNWYRKFPDNLKMPERPLPNIELGEGIIGHVLKTGESYLCPDVTEDPYYFATWPEARSEIAAPLIIDGDVKGILDIESAEFNAFTKRDLKVLTMLASEAAIALRNAQLFKIAEEKTGDFNTLKQVGEALSQRKSLTEILTMIAQQSLHIVGQGNKICFVMMIDREKNMLETKAISGDLPEGRNIEFVVDLNQEQSIVAWVARNGRPHLANDVKTDPLYLEIFPSTRSEICIPLRFRNEVIGVLDIESTELNAFNQHDAEILQALADNTAIAAKIGELCDIRLQQFKSLYEIGKKITATQQLDRVFDLLANEALLAIGPKNRRLYVQLIDREHELVEAKAFAGEKSSIKNYLHVKKSLHEGITGVVIQTKRYYLCPDVKKNPHYVEIDPLVQSELIVPILFNDEVIGLINVESTRKNDFGHHDVDLLQQLANQAGVAIDNAQLNEQLADTQFQLTEVTGVAVVSDALAGLTHDIRTASALISGDVQWIEYLYENNQLTMADVIDAMKKIEAQVERIEQMTGDLMERSRTLPPQFVSANLAEMLRVTLNLTSGYLRRERVNTRIDFDSLDFYAEVDPLRLKRVFINLIKNAVEAMPGGGTIIINAKCHSNFFEIFFTDTGEGIEKEVQDKIWNPFFSSKKGGFGLGLTNCKRIVETDHNGKISMRSVKGKGTKIRIRLPYQQAH